MADPGTPTAGGTSASTAASAQPTHQRDSVHVRETLKSFVTAVWLFQHKWRAERPAVPRDPLGPAEKGTLTFKPREKVGEFVPMVAMMDSYRVGA